MPVMENDTGMADNLIAASDEEVAAIREVLRDADGRKSEVKLAREALGMY